VHWKSRINAAESGNKMIFKRSDCAFSGIATMLPRWYQLKGDVLFSHEGFQNCGALIVEALELRPQTSIAKLLMQLLITGQYRVSGAIFYGSREDAITVIIVEDD
jgi:hypothetical protein